MSTEERVTALLDLVEAHRRARCAEILDRAKAEAGEILRQAYRQARTRVHGAITEERSRYDTAVAAALAQLRTRQRLAHQHRETTMLSGGWRLIPAALRDRWRAPPGRRRWAETHLGRALAALPHVAWEIRHAPGWTEAERAELVAWLGEKGVTQVRFVEDPELAAGFRVHAGRNVLDATLDGLLADRVAIEGRLLHHLEEGNAGRGRQ